MEEENKQKKTNDKLSKQTSKPKRTSRNANKYNKKKQETKQLKRNAVLNDLKNDKNKGITNLKNSNSISDTFHKINYLKQLSSLTNDIAHTTTNSNLSVLSNFYNQSLSRYLLKNKSAVNLSKEFKKFYCKKCFTNKKFNTKQKLLNVHDLSSVTAKSNKKSCLIQKICNICAEKQNIYIGQNEEYISFEESNIS